jgi:hypothetical protein
MVTMVPTSITPAGDKLYYGNPYSSEVREYDTLGRLRRIIRTADQGDRITDAAAEERMAMTIPSNVTGAARTAQMDRLKALPRAAQTWPAFYKVEIGADGTLWLQDFDGKTFAPPDAWTAIDSTGKIAGRLVFPPRAEGTFRPEVLSFGHDHVVIRRFDADGASSVAIFPIVKTDGRSR